MVTRILSISCLGIISLLNIVYSQTTSEAFTKADKEFVLNTNELTFLFELSKNLENKSIIHYVDSVRDNHVYFIPTLKVFLKPVYCGVGCNVSGVILYSSDGKRLCNWTFYSKMSTFHSVDYYYCINEVRHARNIDVGCLKGQECKWYGFSESLFNKDTLGSSFNDFKTMTKEIIRNRKKYQCKRKLRKIHNQIECN